LYVEFDENIFNFYVKLDHTALTIRNNNISFYAQSLNVEVNLDDQFLGPFKILATD